MDGEAIVTVSAAVVALVQLLKWGGIPDRLGALAVLVLAAVGIAIWEWSEGGTFERTQAFQYFAGWIAVATSAAGIFGFTRAASGAVSSMKPPPASGAGTNVTVKD